MFKRSMIVATALLAGSFLVQAPAVAAPASALKAQVETSGVQLVGGRWERDRRHGRHESRRHDRRGGWERGRPQFRGHHGLRRFGYSRYGDFRWDGRGYVTRAHHPRHGWVWVRVHPRSGQPLAYWR